jgi:hypothetical protein
VYGIKRYTFRYDTPDDLRRGGGPRGALLGELMARLGEANATDLRIPAA